MTTETTPTAAEVRESAQVLGADLRELYNKLWLIDRSTLTPKEKEKWRDTFLATLNALEAYENATLTGIVKRMKAESVELQAATGALVLDLHGVQEAAVIIKTIGAGIGVLTRIVTLLA